jgi:small subunit ribosomal protein S20
VANHASAEKRNRQRITRTARNKSALSAVRTFVKKVRLAVASKDKDAAVSALKVAITKLDKAATKGVMHHNTVSRTVSRLTVAVNHLQS